MKKNKLVFFAAVVGVAVVLSGSFLLYRQIGSNAGENQIDRSFDLGVTYVRLTPKQADGLGVTSGALVTRVVPDSQADRAGIIVDDVIYTFNGVRVEDETPLYGMMRCCPVDTVVEMQIWHQQMMRTVTLVNSTW